LKSSKTKAKVAFVLTRIRKHINECIY